MLDGWKLKPLGELVRIASGQVDPKDAEIARNLSIGPDNLRSGGGLEKTGLKTAGELEQISGKYAFDRNAILYSKIRPNLNKIALVDFDGICSADMYPIWVRDDRQAVREFIFYVMNSERFVADATSRSFRTGLPKINRPDLESIEVPLPPLPEQRKIAEILRTWDEAIEKLAALRAAKAHRLDGISQRLLAPSRAVGHGVPHSNWTAVRFGEVFDERQDKNANLGPDDVVTVGKYAIRKQSEHFTRSVASKDLSNYWTISPGDFVYDPMSAYYGAIGRYSGSADGIVSPAYRVIRLRREVDPEFMVALLRTHHIRFLLETRSSQGNKEGKRRLLQRDEFESIEFKLPPKEAQREIAAKLAVFRGDLELTEREIEALTRQKRGLMQKLLTGEWRVAV